MSFFKDLQAGKIKKPLFMALYTRPSVGKTDFGASFPDPAFFDFEESTHMIDVKRKRPTSWEELMGDLDEILRRDTITEFKSLIFDTIDEMERLIHQAVAEYRKKEFIQDVGFQKGYELSINYWADFVSILRDIRDKHQIHILLLAHAKEMIKTDRETGLDYYRYSMSLHHKAADYIFGQVEMVLFAKKEVRLIKQDDRVLAKDSEKRFIYTNLGAMWDAKNRIGLPSQFEMPSRGGFQIIWRAYEKAFNETPETVLAECLEEIKGVKDPKAAEDMIAYVQSQKSNLANLRAARDRIKLNKGEQK
jgi:hypothetical protein